jgi:hypothetical protein
LNSTLDTRRAMTNGRAVHSRRRRPDWFEVLFGVVLGMALFASIGLCVALLAGSLWAAVWFWTDLVRRLTG